MYRESVKWLTGALGLVDDDSPSVPRGLAFALTDASNLGDEAALDSLRPRAERLLSVCDGAPTRPPFERAWPQSSWPMTSDTPTSCSEKPTWHSGKLDPGSGPHHSRTGCSLRGS